MKKYIIRNTHDISKADVDIVNSWPWEGYSSELRTEFRAAHASDRLIISLRCYESDPYAGVTKTNGFVCNDSCMEFFFSPSSDNTLGYFNFEVNSNPTYLFGYNPVGGEGEYVEWDESEYDLRSARGTDERGEFWQIDFELPYALIKKYAPACELSSGSVIRGNVYKCGRHNQPEHYGSWSPIEAPGPNFHMPEFFGEFVLE